MKKLILMAVVSAALAACGGKANTADTTPDNNGGDTGGDTYGGDTGGDAYGGAGYGDMDEGGM